MKPLLALVDLQSAYLKAPNLDPALGAVVARAAALLDAFRHRSLPIAHIRTATPEGDSIERLRDGAGLRPQTGSPEYSPPEAVKELSDEHVIHKSGHSAFSNDATDDLIQKLGVDTIIISGVHTHSCVRQTSLAARERGLQTWVAADAVASDDPTHAAVTFRYLQGRSVRLGSVAQIISMIDCRTAAVETEVQKRAVDDAVATASNFASRWRESGTATRSGYIRSLANQIDRSASQLADAVSAEIGKPIRFSTVEVQRSAEMLRAVAQHAESARDVSGPSGTVIRRAPLGAVAVITPFNNPVYLPLGKIAPAVLFGNSVVWKPAPEASRVSQSLVDLMSEVGWPDGLIHVLDGGREVGQLLVSHPLVDAISITGSSSAGFSAQVAAAERRIPLQAELGGNNAAIVWHDANLETAAAAVASGAFDMSGQRCTANRRVIVHQRVSDSFLQKLMDATRDLTCGSPYDDRTRVGPLVTAERRQRVAEMVSRAERDFGPSVYSDGNSSTLDPDHANRWYPPTILRCNDPDHEIVQEETFGPVLVVQVARDWKDAIRLCNGVRQGLAAAIFTTSSEVTRRFLGDARAGILKTNRSTADASVDVPFGGWKMSGIGPPEHGIFDLEFFTRPQTIYTDTLEGPL